MCAWYVIHSLVAIGTNFGGLVTPLSLTYGQRVSKAGVIKINPFHSATGRIHAQGTDPRLHIKITLYTKMCKEWIYPLGLI